MDTISSGKPKEAERATMNPDSSGATQPPPRRLAFGAALGVQLDWASPPPLAEGFVAEVRAAIVDGLVVRVRGLALDLASFECLARVFGPAYAAPGEDNPVLGNGREVLEISASSTGLLGSGALPWHSDHSFTELPSSLAIAYCVAASDRGGVTRWSNLQLAYERLDADLRRRIVRWKSWTMNPWAGHGAYRNSGGPNQRYQPGEAPRVMHPVVRVHPESGRPSLYLSSLTRGLVDGDGQTIDDPRLLSALLRHIDAPEFQAAHHWSAGDLVVWDNRCTNHKRSEFDPASGRTLWRYQVAGEAPVGLQASAKSDAADA